jgi:hypothetical protein
LPLSCAACLHAQQLARAHICIQLTTYWRMMYSMECRSRLSIAARVMYMSVSHQHAAGT